MAHVMIYRDRDSGKPSFATIALRGDEAPHEMSALRKGVTEFIRDGKLLLTVEGHAVEVV